MHQHSPSGDLAHSHSFLDPAEARNERRTILVVGLTGAMMVAEIVAGTITGSMALLADGWHMASHVAALGLAAFAYRFARRHADSGRYTFGTGKVGPLAGFTSALVLGIIALLMVWESASRLIAPVPIDYTAATIVAALGLAVNLASAAILGGDHHHGPDHDDEDAGAHGHHHHDHNFRAAYLHVLADALTSVLALVALTGARLFGWIWLDPAMGIAGAAVILWWSLGLLRGSSKVLLDEEASGATADRIRIAIEAEDGNRVTDLHLWQIGGGRLGLIVSILTHEPKAPDHYKALLRGIGALAHVTVEVSPCGRSGGAFA